MDIVQFTPFFFFFFPLLFYINFIFLGVSHLCVCIKDRYVSSNFLRLWSVDGGFITCVASSHSVQLLQ